MFHRAMNFGMTIGAILLGGALVGCGGGSQQPEEPAGEQGPTFREVEPGESEEANQPDSGPSMDTDAESGMEQGGENGGSQSSGAASQDEGSLGWGYSKDG